MKCALNIDLNYLIVSKSGVARLERRVAGGEECEHYLFAMPPSRQNIGIKELAVNGIKSKNGLSV